jgi:16S rRNA (guanine966-N2)-methyltransferase
VREALFSALEAGLGTLSGLRFLDLYAGSGAVGLEARSRGAGVVTLVEQDRRTARLIGGNLLALGFTGVEVLTSAVATVVARPASAPYDVVFLDPPYLVPTAEVTDVLDRAARNGWVAPSGLVVVERATRDAEPPWPAGYLPDRSRKYGETTLWYGRAAGAIPDRG